MKTHKNSKNRLSRGFTLVELLVVIVIIVVLASLAFALSRKALLSSRRTAELSNIRQTGLTLTGLASDLGYYPMGWDSNRGMSWADLVVEDLTGGTGDQRQAETLWSPILVRDVPPNLSSEAVTHFGCNPAIMTDVDDNSESTPKGPKWRIRPSQLRRSSEQILLMGAVPREPDYPYQAADPMMREMIPLAGGASGPEAPVMDPASANNPVDFPDGLADEQRYGSLPDFYRGRDGRAVFLFVDGHAQRLAPGEVKEKHLAVSY